MYLFSCSVLILVLYLSISVTAFTRLPNKSLKLGFVRPVLKMSNEKKKSRKIVKYDNVGDPIYEDELQSSSGGVNLLGIQLDLDAPTLALIIFGAIAFNFFVVANL
mmetsp:Transcript_9131/g.15130  ORF Transcript_9131/g.15130 Transcript_9131/m.15130 type:complete len:106 (+) Transcript_9131:27-344(+)